MRGALVAIALTALVGCRQHPDPAVAEAKARAAAAQAQARAAEAMARAAELRAKAAEARQAAKHEPGAGQSADPTVRVGAKLRPSQPGAAAIAGPGAEIIRVVRRHRGRVTRCYARIAKQDRDFAMRKLKLDVEFDLTADGRVSAARVGGLGASELDRQLSTCIVGVFKRMRLPAQPEPRTVRQRYVFTAGPR